MNFKKKNSGLNHLLLTQPQSISCPDKKWPAHAVKIVMVKGKGKIPDKHKQRLYPAVFDLLSKKDFYQVDMRTISRLSGVSIGTIYKYYSSKEELLFSILDEKIAEIWAQMDLHIKGLKSFKEIFRKILWATMNYYDQNPGMAITAFITVPTRTWMQHESFRVNKDVFRATLETARNSEEVDLRIDVRRFQDIYYMICYRCIHSWYYFGRRWNLIDAIDNDFEIFWKMLAPPEQKM